MKKQVLLFLTLALTSVAIHAAEGYYIHNGTELVCRVSSVGMFPPPVDYPCSNENVNCDGAFWLGDPCTVNGEPGKLDMLRKYEYRLIDSN